MKHLLRTPTLYLSALVVIASTPLSLAHAAAVPAQTTGGGQALEIAPPVINLLANPGQSVSSKISLRDVSSVKLLVSGEIDDFTAAGEDGTPKLLLDPNEQSPYSMKTWFKPLGQVLLKPQEIQNLPFTIAVPKDASPGGYFSVVRFTASAPDLNGTGVALSASLGALVFVRVSGDAHEKLSIAKDGFTTTLPKDTRTKKLFEGTPVNFSVRIKNEGNVQEQPTGQILIKDMFGKNVASIPINQPPRNILPGTIRRFDGLLDKSIIGNKMLFGFYKAKLTVTDAKKQTYTQSLVFWVIPWKLILIVVFGLVIGFFLLRNMLRSYNAAIVRRATGTPKPKKAPRKKK